MVIDPGAKFDRKFFAQKLKAAPIDLIQKARIIYLDESLIVSTEKLIRTSRDRRDLYSLSRVCSINRSNFN